MLLSVESTPLFLTEFPFSPPFSKQNGGELTLGTVPERSMEIVFRLTLAVRRVSERCVKQPPHPFQISDFLASRPEADPQQPRSSDARSLAGRQTFVQREAINASLLSEKTLTAIPPSVVGLLCDSSLRNRRSPIYA